MRRYVEAKFTFEGYHCWPEAPDECAFLRSRHRHLFAVRMGVLVSHSNRQVEFISLAAKGRAWVESQYTGGELGTCSCEMLAEELVEQFGLSYCSVREDDGNGALLYAE